MAHYVPREPTEIRILNPYFIQEAAFQFIGLPFNNGLMGKGVRGAFNTHGKGVKWSRFYENRNVAVWKSEMMSPVSVQKPEEDNFPANLHHFCKYLMEGKMFSDHFRRLLTCSDEGTVVLEQWTLNELFNQPFFPPAARSLEYVCGTF